MENSCLCNLDTGFRRQSRPVENSESLYELLQSSAAAGSADVRKTLAKARSAQEISLQDAAILLTAPNSLDEEIFGEAAQLNQAVKGKILTFYGVVYIHDYCTCHCTYCGDSIHARDAKRSILTPEEFENDVRELLKRHDLKEICFLMGEDWIRFSRHRLIEYLQRVAAFYRNKIILNIPPLTVGHFREIREAVPKNRLHFRVFQETFDRAIYAREHLVGSKKDFDWRVEAQSRALAAGFDEVGHGVLYGLNERALGAEFDTLAMIAHARELFGAFGKRSQSMSFPRVLPAPDVKYSPPSPISDRLLLRCVATVKLAEPLIDTVITCRETAAFRRKIRPIVNIEDFAARPGPGGNSKPEVRTQMFLPDMRSGRRVREEIIQDGYEVR